MSSSISPSSGRLTNSLIENMQQISVDRLGLIHPVWRKFILTLNDLPVPRSFGALGEEDRGRLQAWLRETRGADETLDIQDSLLEQKLYVRSYLLLQEGDYAQARHYALCLLDYNAKDAGYLLFLGLAEFGLGHYHDALRYLNLAVHHEPEHVLAHAIVGLIAAFTRDHVRALESTRRALAAPERIAAWGGANWLGLALFQSELLLFGHAAAGGLDSGLFQAVSARAHLEELSSTLPPVHEYLDFASGEKKEVLFVSCDSGYFYKYALPLSLSLVDCQSPLALHLHLINPDDKAFELLQRLSLILRGNLRATYERTDIERICPASVYYSCVRFCRLAQFKLTSGHDYGMIDADMLINRRFNFAEVRKLASTNADCILTYNPNEPIWDCLLAGFCLFGEKSDNILSAISAFILNSIRQKKHRWFLDQVAIFLAVWRECDGRIGYVPTKVFCDRAHTQDSLVWAVTTDKGAEKFVSRAARLIEAYV